MPSGEAFEWCGLQHGIPHESRSLLRPAAVATEWYEEKNEIVLTRFFKRKTEEKGSEEISKGVPRYLDLERKKSLNLKKIKASPFVSRFNFWERFLTAKRIWEKSGREKKKWKKSFGKAGEYESQCEVRHQISVFFAPLEIRRCQCSDYFLQWQKWDGTTAT